MLLFNDLNGDGVLDPDEPFIGSTVTDADGNYSLIGLPPGDYLVAVDTSGTTVDGYLQTTQTLTAGLQAVTVPTNVPPGNAIDQDFGFWSGGYITTPVTLAYFSSEGSGSVSFQWATATETGNLGFHLYVLEEEGLRRLNETLIPVAARGCLDAAALRAGGVGRRRRPVRTRRCRSVWPDALSRPVRARPDLRQRGLEREAHRLGRDSS